MIPETEDKLKAILSPGEKLLWSDRPRQGLLLRKSDAYLIPFTMVWGGFSFFWEYMAIHANAPFFFCLFGVPFMLVGLYIMIGRFFADAARRAKTYYGITPERVIILSGANRQVKSMNIKTLSDITLFQHPDETGTITLGPLDSRQALTLGVPWPGARQVPRLDHIDNVKHVYDKIIALQR